MGNFAFHERVKDAALDVLALGVIVASREGRLIYANAAADRILASPLGALRLRAGKVGTTRCAAQADFDSAIIRACDPASICESGEYLFAAAAGGGAPDLAVRILPASDPTSLRRDSTVILLLQIIDRDCNLEVEARRLFGLTKTEAKFASALAGGLSLVEAAKAQAVTLATARSHMKNIFRKLGVCRQSQVAALLRGARIPIEAPLMRDPARLSA